MICFLFLIYFIISTQFYYGSCMGRQCLTRLGKCDFPFYYDGIRHTICTVDGTRKINLAWCYTNVPFRTWEYCPENCFSNGVSNNVIESCGQTEVDKISLAKKHQFPWNAILGNLQRGSFSPTCNGAIVTRRYILTVASCFYDGFIKEGSVIKVGNIFTRKQGDGQIHKIERIIKHRGYNSSTYESDIAIVESKTNFVYHDKCLPINLLPPKEKLQENQIMTLSTKNIFPYPTERFGYSILQRKKCSDQMAKNIICTNDNDISRVNNLGGLLTHCKDRKVCKLIGLLSKKRDKNNKFVYTDVNKYISWLKEKVIKRN